MTAAITAFRAWIPLINLNYSSTVPLSFVGKLAHELAPVGIANCFSKFSILDQLSLFEGPELNGEGPELSNEGPDLALNTPDQDNTEVETAAANELWSSLWVIGEQVRAASSRKQKSEVEQAIIALCKEAQPHCLRLGDIAQLLGMKPDTLRRNYLSKMVKEQVLFLAYPTIPNHPEQGYKLHKD